MINDIALYSFLAISFESIAEYLWNIRDFKKNIPAYMALALALAGVFTIKLDIFALLGFTVPYSWVTIMLTGFALGRGASFFHDVQGWVQQKYMVSKTGTAVADEVAGKIDGQ